MRDGWAACEYAPRFGGQHHFLIVVVVHPHAIGRVCLLDLEGVPALRSIRGGVMKAARVGKIVVGVDD